jgi:hypothetical protein
MRTLYSMKAITRDKEIEDRAWKMVTSKDEELVNLGYSIYRGYMLRYKFYIEIRKDYIIPYRNSDQRWSIQGERANQIEKQLRIIAKNNEFFARFEKQNLQKTTDNGNTSASN